MLLDSSWSWVARGRALTRAEGGDYVTLTKRLPDALLALWPDAPAASPAQRRRLQRKVLAVGGAVVAVLAGAGAAAWRLTGESDFLVAGLSFAGLVAVRVGGGLIAAARLSSGAGRP